MSPEGGKPLKAPKMARERHGIELVRYCVDWVRGLGGLVFAVALGSWWWLRRDRDRRLPN